VSAGFTPGPWQFSIEENGPPDDPHSDTFFLGQLDDETGGIYGTILEGGLVLASAEENIANARLIAAAPELYQSCESFVACYPPALQIVDERALEEAGCDPVEAALLASAVRALAKARGSHD
jgi:hypothetical protein